MPKRTLEEIKTEIKQHEEAIKVLRQEVKDFQADCPHPENFKKVVQKSYDDEYGRLEGYHIITTCLLCGHQEYKEESADYFKSNFK